ncbi:cyclophilin-like domain-containing protein [Scheffersomyces coipomensis]|uniref:cyclophilin-like domain-containing protein n=1 Tax=Scheffersomyces coipomensis TaxID=1788519 RepID=UPI00315D7FD8
MVRSHAYLDISIAEKPIGRIVVQLYDDLAPKSTETFLSLIKGTTINDKFYSYKHNIFHRILKNFVVQAGDVIYGMSDNIDESNIGKGSILKTIPDENLTEAIDAPFKLCMAHEPNVTNANGSQFFITCFPQPHLTGQHSVFGQVIHGKSVVREMERVNTNKLNIPQDQVLISDCGVWDETMDVPVFNASYDPIGGDIYEEHPDDDEHIDKDSSESVYIAASIIKESGTLLFKQGKKQEAYLKWKKCIRYIMEYIPDEDQEKEWYAKYIELKKKTYLNVSLVCLQLKNYKQSLNYCDYLLDMPSSLSTSESAKINYRKGLNLIQFKKYKQALINLKVAHELLPSDELIKREFEKCQSLIDQEKLAEKVKYAKFFS